jgi:hypothetical protein
MHQKAAVPIEDVHQVVPLGRDPYIHQVHVSDLVGVVRIGRSLPWLGQRSARSMKEIVLFEDPIDLVGSQLDNVFIHHPPSAK